MHARVNWRELHGGAFEGRRVLVTGGAGFIGSHLSEALSRLGAEVVVLDDLSGGDVANLDAWRSEVGGRVEFVKGSILDEAVVRRCTAGCQYVFHQAALGSVPRSVAEPETYVRVNVVGTFSLLEAARRAKVRRVMFAASSSAYGDTPTLPKVETMPPQPRSPYAASKVAGEALMAAYSASYGLDTACLRYFNIFGPRQNANSAYAAVIAAFAKALLAGEQPVIFGDGEQSRDFTYVANAVHANLLAARQAGHLAGAVINVACGQRISVGELAKMAAAAVGRPELLPRCEPPRAGDVKHSLADLSRAREMLGYQPIVEFAAGLKPTLEWYRAVLAQAG